MISEATPVRFTGPLPDQVDVAVIGAGIAGTAIAYFLAERGVRVLLLEKGRVAGEQSSRNWGWIRQQGRDAAELPIMMESNRIWRGLAAETGETDLTFSQTGCVYLAEDEASARKYESWLDLAQEHQLETRMLTRAQIAETLPHMKGDWVGGMITPTDGKAEPFVAVPALARSAERSGAIIRENCAVRTLEVSGGRVSGVVTEAGAVKCDRVVLAGGAWSSLFAGNEGLNLPLLTIRSTVARTEAAPDLDTPNVSGPGISLRRRTDGGYTVTSADLVEHYLSPGSLKHFLKFTKLMRLSARDLRLMPSAPAGQPGAWLTQRRWSATQETPFERVRVVNPKPSQIVLDRITERLPQRVPALKDVKLAEAWAGMIDVTPDAVPVLDEAPAIPGFFLATGLSGHGFGIGPAVGRIMADLVEGKPTGYDLSRFRFGRFSDGSEIVPGPY